MTIDVSRRSLLTLGAGLGASAMLGSSALARAPKLGTQTPYWHRFVLGDAEVTVVSDGPLPLGDPSGTFTGVSKEEVKKMLVDNFLSPDNVVLEQNSPIVNTGDKLILFDTGMGSSKMFGPPPAGSRRASPRQASTRGHRRRGLLACPYRPHRRHRGRRRQAAISERADLHLADRFRLLDRRREARQTANDFVVHARKNLLPNRDRIVFFKDGQEFLPGVQAIVGARSYRRPHHVHGLVGRQDLAFLGDLSHHQVLLVERPRMEFSYDTDPSRRPRRA